MAPDTLIYIDWIYPGNPTQVRSMIWQIAFWWLLAAAVGSAIFVMIVIFQECFGRFPKCNGR